MNKIITRFAPSPTGFLHIGNARTAIINWLYARKNNGKFILRFDDTDVERSKEKYKEAILKDFKWLGLNFDLTFNQSNRMEAYKAPIDNLIKKGRLYPCFETSEELEMKRKLLLTSGKPPIYDRSSLNLTEEQTNKYLKEGRKPHYRFLINNSPIKWDDMIKGEMHYEGGNLSDPIVIREDGSMTYMLCSTIDDIDYEITHILRGVDHITNTAIQIQMFEALNAKVPNFGHLSFVMAQSEKISKRAGGFEVATLRDEEGLESMTINSFFSQIGSSQSIQPCKNLEALVEKFDIKTFSKSPTTYMPEELMRLNHKILLSLSYEDVKDRLLEIGATMVDKQFWLAVRPNLQKLKDIKDWWKICHNPEKISGLDMQFLKQAADLFPEGEINQETWGEWTMNIMQSTGKKGKELFLPLRLALTGMEHGPELKNILPMLDKEEILRRLI